MSYYGDIRLGDTIDIKFTTRQISGAPFTLAGTPVISAYVGNGTTEITAGITLTVDFDARTGLNNVRVVATSGNGFATATNVQLVITTGTVNSVSVVGEVIGSFSIECRSALMPTTATRTLDVSATGEAGLDWANIGSPTTAVAFTATTLADTLTTGTAQAGAANTITLAAGASATDGLYDPGLIIIRSGTGAGQCRTITQYTGSTKVAAVDRDWRTNPDNTSVYVIIATPNLESTNEGLATGGGASTITLNANASAVDNFYNGQYAVLRSGTGQDQVRRITGYVGATKVATVASAWATNPAAGTGYAIWPASLGELSNLDAAISSRMATYTQPTGFLAATFPASVSSYAGGAVASVTAPVTVGTNNDKTGYSLTQTFPANFSSLAISAAGNASADIKKVNGTTVNGDGSIGTPWGP